RRSSHHSRTNASRNWESIGNLPSCTCRRSRKVKAFCACRRCRSVVHALPAKAGRASLTRASAQAPDLLICGQISFRELSLIPGGDRVWEFLTGTGSDGDWETEMVPSVIAQIT